MRYVLCPGYVQSNNDGQWHFITAPRLAELYGVDLKECFIYDRYDKSQLGFRAKKGDLLLRPRRDGKYVLTKRVVMGK